MIYICIPALDEAPTIGLLLWKIRRVFTEFPRDYHIVVVDDASTDDTAEVLKPYADVLPVSVLVNARTEGYAASLERALREAVRMSTHPKRDIVVTLQGDFTETPDDIPALIRKMEGGADVVGGTVVQGDGPEVPRALRWSRKGLPWLLPRAALPKEIRDPLSGFRAYRISVLKRALGERRDTPLVKGSGWAANVALLLAVRPHARRVEDAEISLRYDRRERATRFEPWSAARELWTLARATPRQVAPPASRAAEPVEKS